MALPFLVGRGQRLAVDHGNHLVDSGLDPAVEIPRFEMRRDGLLDDAVGDRIGQRSFQAPPHLDAHAAIILGHKQDRPVINPLAARLPRLGDAMLNCSISSGAVVGTMSTTI